MASLSGDHTDVFVALDRVYGLIDGSTAWSSCLDTLIRMADLDAAGLCLYDCARGHSHVVDSTGIGFTKGRLIQKLTIDESLWQTPPGEIWLPVEGGSSSRSKAAGLQPFGYTVLDRDSTHILYVEFLQRRDEPFMGESDDGKPVRRSSKIHLLHTVLPHLHRACRLHRSITGDDLMAFTAPGLHQPAPSAGLPIELRLRRRFRLSKAEARVATLLSDGLAPRMIADRLNVSIHTVRSQLQAIFNKTDTSRQAELTSLILRETEVPRAAGQTGTVSMEQSEQPSCP